MGTGSGNQDGRAEKILQKGFDLSYMAGYRDYKGWDWHFVYITCSIYIVMRGDER